MSRLQLRGREAGRLWSLSYCHESTEGLLLQAKESNGVGNERTGPDNIITRSRRRRENMSNERSPRPYNVEMSKQ